MSLYSALFAGVSGLNAQSAAMASVADNIANINTVGYKAVDTQFSTLVGDGRSQGLYSAGGVSAVARPLISKAGQLGSTSSSTDLGIDGQGFFVTRTGAGKDSTLELSRAGSFTTNTEGYLTNTAGLYLQGWRLDANGKYANTGNADALEPIKVSDLAGSAAATTKIQMRVNLQSTTPVGAATYTVGDIATATTPADFSKPFDVYDQQGGAHRVSFSLVKRGDNQWAAEAYAVPASDVTAANGLLASGTIKFKPDGSLDRAGSSPALFAPFTPVWTNNAGALPITLGLGTDKGIDGLSQFGSASSLISSSVDGGMLGNISSTDVSANGVVSVVFDNGTKRPLFQLPIATVPNPDGLDRVNGNAFTISANSGSFALNTPGSLGAGKIESFKLEASTADLAQEFTNMIRFQRAYSASSKVITTADEMLQEVSNLKR